MKDLSPLFLIITFLSTISNCFSQQITKLSDINKITLVTREGGLSNEKRILEIVSTSSGWKCYQTRNTGFDLKEKKMVDDSTRIFQRGVAAQTLQRLLDIIAKKDTGIHPDLFNVDRSELPKYIDSLKIDLTPAQRIAFVDSLRSENVVNAALEVALKPFPMDDRTYYGITFETKQNTKHTIYALSFADLYNIPWHIDNIKSFDPNIAIIFESIFGFDKFAEAEKKELYRRMVQKVYVKYFRAQSLPKK